MPMNQKARNQFFQRSNRYRSCSMSFHLFRPRLPMNVGRSAGARIHRHLRPNGPTLAAPASRLQIMAVCGLLPFLITVSVWAAKPLQTTGSPRNYAIAAAAQCEPRCCRWDIFKCRPEPRCCQPEAVCLGKSCRPCPRYCHPERVCKYPVCRPAPQLCRPEPVCRDPEPRCCD
jgi:hypothetical protein